MAPVKIKFVVSFSSQDKLHKVSNLLAENSSTKRWLSDPQDRTGQIDVVFQLERPCRLAYIDIGVIWCASVEVRVGKSDWPQGQSYVTLVPTQIIMSPHDSRLSRNTSRTCMFSKGNFTEEGSSNSEWDRIQVIGRQPWRKDVQLGISFLRLSCNDSLDPAFNTSMLLTSDADHRSQQRMPSVADIKRHFFGNKKNEEREDSELKKRLQKIAAGAEGVTANPNVLSRNARMVLMANKNSTKSNPVDQDSASQGSVASTDEQPEQSVKPEEVARFLELLGIKKEDIESLQVSDLRHEFERVKRRKLTQNEKCTFYSCCQDFVGHMFDDDASDVTSTDCRITDRTGISEYGSPHRNKHTAAERTHTISRTRTSATHDVSTPRTKNVKSVNTSPRTSCGMTPKDIRHNSGGQTPRPDHRLSGGFLTSVVSVADKLKDKSCVTPNEKTNGIAVSKSRDGQETTNTSQGTSHRTSPAPMLTKRGKSKDTVMSPKSVSSVISKSSSPESAGSSSTSKINKTLLNSHKQFVKGRLENISASHFSNPGPSSAVATISVSDDDSASEEPTPSVFHTVSSRHSGKRTPVSAKKPEGTQRRALKDVTSAKQQLKPSVTARDLDACSQVRSGQWLNARRGKHRNSPAGGDRAGSNNLRLLYSSDESDSLQSPESSNGTRGQKRRRGGGQGRGAVKRRLEMESEPTASTSYADSHDSEKQLADYVMIDDLNTEPQFDNVTYTNCPLCQIAFPDEDIENHASDCTGPPCASDDMGHVQCPLCNNFFDANIIEEHASLCECGGFP